MDAARTRTPTWPCPGAGPGRSTCRSSSMLLDPLGTTNARIGPLQAWAQEALPPHDDASHEHDRRRQSDDRPDGAQRFAAPSPEVEARQPHEDDIAWPIAEKGIRIGDRIDEVRERFRNPEIDPRHAPYQHEQEQPEAERAVQIPVDARPAPGEFHSEATPPARDAGPPDDRAGEDQHRHHRAEGAVPVTALSIEQQLVVETCEPDHGELALRDCVAEVGTGVRVEQ